MRIEKSAVYNTGVELEGTTRAGPGRQCHKGRY